MGKKLLCILLACVLAFGSQSVADGAKKAKLSFSKVKLEVGQKKKIVIKNKNKKAKYTYKSSLAKKIAVNKKGVITAKKPGKANITVSEKISKKTRKVGVIKVTCKNDTDKTPEAKTSDTPVPTPVNTPSGAPDMTGTPSKTPEPTPEPTPDLYTTKIMTVTVNDTDSYFVDGNTCYVNMQYFTGSAEGEYFNGTVLKESTVVTKEYKEDKETQYCARYILKGTDASGSSCSMYIEDNGIKDEAGNLVSKPVIVTDSKELAWIETADIQGRVTDNGNGEKTIDILWNESNTEPVPPPQVVRPDTTKSYTRELFTFYIDIGPSDEVNGNTGNASMIHFGGRGEGPNFNGTVVKDSVDARLQFKGQVQTLSARYILEGTDANGNPCKVYVENNGIDDNGMVTEPTIITDCPDYAWIESAPLHGTVSWAPQLTIHMWTTED